jgi:tRNA(Glu) U13 pseudouridine synthase TruD
MENYFDNEKRNKSEFGKERSLYQALQTFYDEARSIRTELNTSRYELNAHEALLASQELLLDTSRPQMKLKMYDQLQKQFVVADDKSKQLIKERLDVITEDIPYLKTKKTIDGLNILITKLERELMDVAKSIAERYGVDVSDLGI